MLEESTINSGLRQPQAMMVDNLIMISKTRPALVEWSFSKETVARATPEQEGIVSDPSLDALDSVFAPATDDGHETPPERHSRLVHSAYIAGGAEPPFLLNLVAPTPQAIETLAERGVRVFSFSSSAPIKWDAMETVMTEHPEVLFIVATPHIAGNDVSTWELNEVPSCYARKLKNVVLVGAAEFYDQQMSKHLEGQRLGTAKNPFEIDNQPADGAREYFMASTKSSDIFAPGLGGTSVAAPLLASLAEIATELIRDNGLEPTAPRILERLDSVMQNGFGKAKTGALRPIKFFTMDTILLNRGRPLITSTVWRGLSGMPPAQSFTDAKNVTHKKLPRGADSLEEPFEPAHTSFASKRAVERR